MPPSSLPACPAPLLLPLLLPSLLLFVQAFDAEDASITDAALIRFLSASGPWLAQVQAVDVKHCHYITRGLLAFLRTACPKLRKLAPSRWAEHTAMAEVALFPALEVRPRLGWRARGRAERCQAAAGSSVLRCWLLLLLLCGTCRGFSWL